MLQLKNVVKVYSSGETEVKALKGINLSFRKSEFVSVLGPSGCGKTTMLNILGGLDRYTDGDLVINGVSTKNYVDSDWDSYRNHSVGFVFQSYNLIPHQTVEKNVELALTLSGVGKETRLKKAREALALVGLKDQCKKLPNQLSGGQMQRVAIARAIVNDPDIILADEPTGALDSETSIQVMEILKELAKTRLVVMVTHNAELAKEYSTRIISLKDGLVVDDTMPYSAEEAEKEGREEVKRNAGKKVKKPSMSFLTALSLSLNNLFTKKGRTILTAFAGSIGIIGIALILSLSAGFNTYIQNVQRDTLSNYPVMITSQSFNYSSMLSSFMGSSSHEGEEFPNNDELTSQDVISSMLSSLASSVNANDLASFKKYLDENADERFINAIQYTYDLQTSLYIKNEDASGYRQLAPVSLPALSQLVGAESAKYYESYYSGFQNLVMSEPILAEAIDNRQLIEKQYDFLKGHYPENKNEILLVVDNYNQISDLQLYMMGLMNDSDIEYVFKRMLVSAQYTMAGKTLTKEELDEKMQEQFPDLKRSDIASKPLSFDDLIGREYKLFLTAESYTFDEETGLYTTMTAEQKKNYLETNAETLKISGIVRLKKGITTGCLPSTLCYTKEFTEYLIDKNDGLPVVKALKASYDAGGKGVLKPDGTESPLSKVNSTTSGVTYSIFKDFEGTDDRATKNGKLERRKIEDYTYYVLLNEDGTPLLDKDGNEIWSPRAPEQDVKYRVVKSYAEREKSLGLADIDTPTSISIFPTSFEAKDDVIQLINDYNASLEGQEDGENKKIKYEDYIGLMMSSVTTIVNAVTYVLIAFVSTSLIVSSIMIGIITYISVLERTKEIGVLRSIGASKRDVARVFNAETMIIGLTSGVMGIAITLLLNIPINAIITALSGLTNVAALPVWGGISLVLISVGLTVIAGLVPSKMASKKDPVIALRSE